MSSQFDVSSWFHCPATDDEGFRCAKPPSHRGEHRWFRCEWTDANGRMCLLPPRHPGDHWLFWYDRPARPGDTHAVHYAGTENAAWTIARGAARVCARHDWVLKSHEFEPGWLWRWRALSPLHALLGDPHGRLTVVFEYRPRPAGEEEPGDRPIRGDDQA